MGDKALDGSIIIKPRTTDLKEIKFEGVNWIHLAQDRDQWLAL
jgi:hypothetical protein